MDKIIVHKIEKYETTDGKTFTDLEDAKRWQKYLDDFENLVMLTEKLEQTKKIENAIYIIAKTQADCDCYNSMNNDSGYSERYNLISPGYYMFSDSDDRYVNIDNKIKELNHIKETLDKFCQN